MGREDTFSESCKWLRSKDAQSNYTSSHKATRKAPGSKTVVDTPALTSNELEFLVNYTNEFQLRCKQRPRNGGSFSVVEASTS